MILTDGVHLVSDTSLDELHDFARELGLKRVWFQDGRLPHYDMTAAWRVLRAQKMGAHWVSSQELVRRMYRRRTYGEKLR